MSLCAANQSVLVAKVTSAQPGVGDQETLKVEEIFTLAKVPSSFHQPIRFTGEQGETLVADLELTSWGKEELISDLSTARLVSLHNSKVTSGSRSRPGSYSHCLLRAVVKVQRSGLDLCDRMRHCPFPSAPPHPPDATPLCRP